MNNKRKKIIIAVFTLIILLAVIWFFLFLNTDKRSSLIEETKNFFPFGKIETGLFEKQDKQKIEEKDKQDIEEKVKIIKKEAGPRLRQISDFPTGGFAPIVRISDKDVVDISIDSNGVKSEINKTIQVKNNFVRYSSIKDSTIYESYVDPYEIKENVIVENFIPNTEQAFFSKDGNHVVFQYWDSITNSISTYLSKIEKNKIEIRECPYDFSKQINIGDESKYVLGIHEFLNENPRTQVAEKGINSPGNESSLAVPATITAIKNFQSLNGLDIDGKIGPSTRKKMLEICNAQQKEIAEKEFTSKKEKYSISGFFLPQKITAISIAPDGNNFFYIESDKIGVVGIKRNFSDNTKKTIFESPYYGWIVNWNNKDNIQLTTKASYKSKGYSYSLDPNTGEYHKSFKEKQSLTTLASPDNTKIFIHEIKGNTIANSIFQKESYSFIEIPIQTFPEKCVWGKESIFLYCAVPNSMKYGEKYPDKWYQGLEIFDDSLWKINSETGKIELLSDLDREFNKKIDVFKIGIDGDNDYLYFIDKSTEFLWSYRLTDD